MRASVCATLGILAAAAVGFGGVASAQIGEIVVTAQKRAQNVQDVPISITALSGAALEDSGVDEFAEAAFLIPNFQFTQSNQLINARIGVRGVNSVGNSGFESSVGVFVDEVFVPRPGSTIGTLFDLGSVELLRGPQGTLFGRNTSVGALSVTTRAPTDSFEGEFKIGGGDLDGVNVGGYFSGPITETLKGRFAYQINDKNAYLDNSFENDDELDRQDYSVRGRLAWEPTESFRADLIVDYSKIDYTGANIQFVEEEVTTAFLNRFQTIFGVPVGEVNPFDENINQVHSDAARNTQYGITLKLEKEAFGHTWTSISGYRDWEDDYRNEDVVRLAADILPRDRISATDNFSQELRITSPSGGKIDYIFGAFYYEETYDTDTVFHLGADYCNDLLPALGAGPASLVGACNAAPRNAVVDDFGQELTAYAVFAHATWRPIEKVALTGGLRWSRDEKTGFASRVVNNAAAIIAPANTRGSNLGIVQEDEEVTYNLTGQYFFTPDIMAFATYATGFKSGGINSEPQNINDPRTFRPELVDNYEIGLKSTLFQNRVVANITFFSTEIEDFQERTFDGQGFIVGNAGTVRQRGFEVDSQIAPNPFLNFNIGVAYLDSEFLSFTGAPGLPGGSVQDLTGERRPDSPEWTFSLAGQWTQPIADSLEWFVRGEYQWVDEQFQTANLNPQSLEPSFDLANFRTGLSGNGGGWQLTAFVRNAFDEGYCTRRFDQVLAAQVGAQDTAAMTAVQRCVVNTPRSFGGELRVHF